MTPTDIHLSKGIEIKSEADYRAVTSILDILAASQPALKSGEYWAERFFRWLTDQKDDDDDDGDSGDEKGIEDQPLKPTPEPLLTRLIAGRTTPPHPH